MRWARFTCPLQQVSMSWNGVKWAWRMMVSCRVGDRDRLRGEQGQLLYLSWLAATGLPS